MAPIVYWSHSFVGKRSILVGIRLVRRSKPHSCWQHTWKKYDTSPFVYIFCWPSVFFYMQNHPKIPVFGNILGTANINPNVDPNQSPNSHFCYLKSPYSSFNAQHFPNLLWKSQFLLTRSFLQAKSPFLPIKHDRTKIFRGEIHLCTIEIPLTWKCSSSYKWICSSSYKWIYNQSSSGDIPTYGS